MKRMIAGVLTLCLTAGLMSGCAAGEKPGGGAEAPMGRYIEEQGEVFTGLKEVYDYRSDGAGGATFYGGGAEGFHRYTVPAAGGDAASAGVPWLDRLAAEGYVVTDISQGAGKLVYALVRDEKRGFMLFSTEDGETCAPVPVPDWAAPGDGDGVIITGNVGVGAASVDAGGTMTTITGDMGAAPAAVGGTGGMAMEGAVGEAVAMGKWPDGIFALPDGGFVACLGRDGAARYGADGALLAQFPGNAYKINTAVFGNQLLMKSLDDQELWRYDLEKAEQTGTYTYENMSFRTLAGMDADGVLLADATGIYRQAEGGALWERLVDGDLTSMAMPNQSLAGLTADGTGGFLGLMRGETTHQMMRYVYSAETPTNPDTELTIFGLGDSSTVRQTIGEFQRRNPSVRVNFQIAQSGDSAATTEDVIRSLNTELLSGKGPDLLLLDGLPVDSYIDKGVLADITDLVGELTLSQGLLENLMGAYGREGKTYGVPARFSVPVMLGGAGDTDQVASLRDLADLVKTRQGETVPFLYPPDRLWEDEGMVMDYYDFCAGAWSDGKQVDEAALADYLTHMLSLNTTLRESTPEMGGTLAMVTMAASTNSGFEPFHMGPMAIGRGEAQFSIQDLFGLLNLASIAENVGDMEGQKLSTLFGGDGYIPMGGVGIVASGGQQELARAFVEMLLSSTVQDQYLYDGFSVNGKSLDKMVADKLKENELTGDMGFTALCRTLKTPLVSDKVVKEAVRGQVKDLLSGESTPEQAAAAATEQTALYRAE